MNIVNVVVNFAVMTIAFFKSLFDWLSRAFRTLIGFMAAAVISVVGVFLWAWNKVLAIFQEMQSVADMIADGADIEQFSGAQRLGAVALEWMEFLNRIIPVDTVGQVCIAVLIFVSVVGVMRFIRSVGIRGPV